MDQNRKIKLFFAALLGAHACFIIYGSMVPFGFEYMPLSDAWDRFRTILTSPVGRFSRANLLANILIGIPGPFLFLAVFHNNKNRMILVLIPAALLYSAALACTAEYTQLFLPRRFTMLSDILAQTLGGAIGAVIWLWLGPESRAMLKALIFRDSQIRIESLIFWGYMVVMLLFHALPLDMTARLGVLYAQLEDGRIVLVPFSNWSGISSVINSLQTIFIWMPMGWFLVKFRSWSLFAVFLATLMVPGVFEGMQIFVLSRTTDTTDIILGAAGGIFGGAAGACGSSWKIAPAAGSGKIIIFAGLLFTLWIFLVVQAFWYPFTFNFDKHFLIKSIRNTGLVPLQMYVGKNYLRSAYNILEIFIYFIPLGVIFSSFITRWSNHRNTRVMTGVFFITACLTALVIEFGQVFIPGRYPDITDMMIMITGALLGHSVTNMAWKRQIK